MAASVCFHFLVTISSYLFSIESSKINLITESIDTHLVMWLLMVEEDGWCIDGLFDVGQMLLLLLKAMDRALLHLDMLSIDTFLCRMGVDMGHLSCL